MHGSSGLCNRERTRALSVSSVVTRLKGAASDRPGNQATHRMRCSCETLWDEKAEIHQEYSR
jgi:hypothetical protein